MVIKFSPTFPRLTHTDTRAKYLHVPQVWVVTKPCLLGHDSSHGVHTSVVDIHGVDKGRRPVACGDTGSVNERMSGDCECLVPTFHMCILGGAIKARGFNHISMMVENFQSKICTSGLFPAQVGMDITALRGTMKCKEVTDQINQWIFQFLQKHPNIMGGLFCNNEVST
jgi:hypothetical protein